MYQKGEIVHQDYSKAVEWYQKAADQNLPIAQYNLAYCYEFGLGTEQNYQKAIELYRKAAAQNYGLAKLNLGCCYLDGNGVEKNSRTAIRWFKKAAAHNINMAQYNIGQIYLNGNQIPSNIDSAEYWLRQAANYGHPDAQYFLGCAYRDGIKVKKNDNLAAIWMKKAAFQGHGFAQNNYGFFFHKGIGVEQDPETAEYWYRQAMNQYVELACANLLWLHIKPEGDSLIPIKEIPKEAEPQSVEIFQKGFSLLYGLDCEINYPEALNFLTNATLLGNQEAREVLAYCYATAYGIHPNQSLAAKLFVGRSSHSWLAEDGFTNTVTFEIFPDGTFTKSIDCEIK